MPDLVWRTSTRCDSGTCVQVSATESLILVRDSKLGDDSPVLAYTRREWAGLLHAIKQGDGYVDIDNNADMFWNVWARDGKELRFDDQEMYAFIGDENGGVLGGEFDLPEVTA